MKRNRAVLFVALSVLCLSLAVGFVSALQVRDAVGDRLFALSFVDANAAFSDKDIAFLTREGHYFTFTAGREAEVATEIRSSRAEVVGTNASFASVRKAPVLSGFFFNDIHEAKASRVAVLNAAAAWHFFGNMNCAGDTIRIDQVAYRVVGVVENDSLDKDSTQIYIPYADFTKHQSENHIRDLLIAADGLSYIDLLLRNLGYLPEDVRILDLEQYKGIVMQRSKIIFFAGGLCLMFCLLKRSMGHMKALEQEAVRFFRENYVRDIWMLVRKREVLIALGSLAGQILLSCLIVAVVQFKVYLPYYFFSLKGFDYAVWNELLAFFVQPHISVSLLQHMNGLNMISNLMFCVSVLSGGVVLVKGRAARRR